MDDVEIGARSSKSTIFFRISASYKVIGGYFSVFSLILGQNLEFIIVSKKNRKFLIQISRWKFICAFRGERFVAMIYFYVNFNVSIIKFSYGLHSLGRGKRKALQCD